MGFNAQRTQCTSGNHGDINKRYLKDNANKPVYGNRQENIKKLL